MPERKREASRPERRIREEILDELLADYNNPEDLIGKDGIFDELKKRLYSWDGSNAAEICIPDLSGYAVRPESVEIIEVDGEPRVLFVEDRFKAEGYDTRNAVHWPVSILN